MSNNKDLAYCLQLPAGEMLLGNDGSLLVWSTVQLAEDAMKKWLPPAMWTATKVVPVRAGAIATRTLRRTDG